MADNNYSKGKLTRKHAESKIREILKLGNVIPTNHFNQRLKDRNYDIQDVNLVLSKGRVTEPPKYNEKFCNWEYKVEGEVIEGDKAIVVVSILSHSEMVCITIKPR